MPQEAAGGAQNRARARPQPAMRNSFCRDAFIPLEATLLLNGSPTSDIVVVADSSTDGTAQIAEDIFRSRGLRACILVRTWEEPIMSRAIAFFLVFLLPQLALAHHGENEY